MLFTASDLASIISHVNNWVLFLLWLYPFIPSGVIFPLILHCPPKRDTVSLMHRPRECALIHKQGHYRCNQLWGGHGGGGSAPNTIPLVSWWERTGEHRETAHEHDSRDMGDVSTRQRACRRARSHEKLPRGRQGLSFPPQKEPILRHPDLSLQPPASRAGDNACPLLWATTSEGLC